jgi:hypothetical protein
MRTQHPSTSEITKAEMYALVKDKTNITFDQIRTIKDPILYDGVNKIKWGLATLTLHNKKLIIKRDVSK